MFITKKIKMELGERSYDITVGQGLLSHANEFMNLSRKVAVITDSGVPEDYAKTVAALCGDAKIITFPQGEASKNIDTYSYLCKQLLDFELQRKDAVVAVGGGVCGDISGFVASTYMRGIDFYNIPTTLLSQVDSSIGGKCAIDFFGVKNILGAFYQPRAVLIDTDTLDTLDKRQLASGLAEVIKMALTSNSELFEKLDGNIDKNTLPDIITEALLIKKSVVEADERESGLRKILNFGHTLGHGIESLGGLYHGECVALGMIPMCAKGTRERLIKILSRVGLPTEHKYDFDKIFEIMKHDKKGDGEMTDVIFVDTPGSCRIEKVALTKLLEHIKRETEV